MEHQQVFSEFDGYLNSEVQFAIQIALDIHDKFKGVVEVFEFELIADGLLRVRDRLAELGSLVRGWHDGHGEPIGKPVLDAVARLAASRPGAAEIMHLYPTDIGGVLIEFSVGGWDYSIEFLPDGNVEFSGTNLAGEGELESLRFAGCTSEFYKMLETDP